MLENLNLINLLPIQKEEDTKTNENEAPNRARRKRKPSANASKPEAARKATSYSSAHLKILEGLEEDVIEMNDANKGGDEDDDDDGYKPQAHLNTDEEPSSQRELIANKNAGEFKSKSVPTDKFYLELEKKFEIKNKQAYEKREQERLQQMFASQLKQKQKEELKYQISTPKTALMTHRFLRVIFLFVHGINVGFQVWQAIITWLLNISQIQFSTLNYPSFVAQQDQSYVSSYSLFLIFEQLTMPIHCISYLFLTLCIVDTMDR